jgi:CheY-like chemotaxis protein
MPYDILNLLQTLLLPLAIGTVVVTALLVWLIGRKPAPRQRPVPDQPHQLHQLHQPHQPHQRPQGLPEAATPVWQPPPAIAPLPDMPDMPAQPATASAAATPPSTPPTARPRKADLLLVDDSAVVRTRLRRLFQPAGYSLALAADGEAALTLLAEGRYGLLITDLEMPRLDGMGLIRAVMADPVHAGMPMLAITGHDDLQAQLNQLHAAAGIYRKPWVDDDLLGHVQSLVAPSLLAETATEEA